MSADPRVEPFRPATSGLAEALYFDSGEQRLFGWLHGSTETGANIGVVICKPFGYEAICSHRSVRALAEAVAAMGIPALRFDYLGAGDSADIEPQADQLDVWTRDVIAAVGELRRRTGVEQVCLLGIRFGALLAALASSQCKAVDALILIAPIVSGRRYLRELRTTRMAAMLGAHTGEQIGSSTAGSIGGRPNSMEVSGFSLSSATLTTLAQLDMLNLKAPPAPEILVIDGISLPTAGALAETLSRLGAKTKYLTLPGLIEMTMTAPQFATVPQTMIDAAREWLYQFLAHAPTPAESGGRRCPGSTSSASTNILTLPGTISASHGLVTERPVFFATETVLFGIVTEPGQGETRRRAVILLNAGADYHIGASRMYVSLSRRWARRGYVVLRMDLAGIGDSSKRPGNPDDDVFPTEALDDIKAAIDFLRSRYNIQEITLAGLCSGAYHALRAAAAGLAISRILMINPQNYFWKKGMTLNDLQLAEVVRNPGVYRQQVVSAAAWKRLLTGQVNVWRIANIYVQRFLLALESALRDVARRLRIRLPHDLGWELEAIGSRGVRMVFVFARGEPGIDLLKIEGGSSVKRLGERCRVHIVDSGDHIFSHSNPRAVLENILSDELFARVDWGPSQQSASNRG
jgi:alpha-beta hydrolase superfamily lysophospholipase